MNGETLRKKLEAGGYTVSSVAKLMNTKSQNISQILNTVKDVKTGFLEDLCKALNVNMTFFYGGTQYLPQNTKIDEDKTNSVPISLYNQILKERDMYMLKLTKYEETTQILQKNAG